MLAFSDAVNVVPLRRPRHNLPASAHAPAGVPAPAPAHPVVALPGGAKEQGDAPPHGLVA